MNLKIYKGYELLKAIEDKEITEKQKVYLICMDKIPLFWKYGFLNIPELDGREERNLDMFDLMSYDFEVEILEDNTEEIEDLTYFCIGNAKSTEQTKMIDKINELVKRINYIERKINEN